VDFVEKIQLARARPDTKLHRLRRGAGQERPDRGGQAFFISGGKHEI
jgi:hypothetical protein